MYPCIFVSLFVFLSNHDRGSNFSMKKYIYTVCNVIKIKRIKEYICRHIFLFFVDRPDKWNKTISEFERVLVFSVFLVDTQDVYVVEIHRDI